MAATSFYRTDFFNIPAGSSTPMINFSIPSGSQLYITHLGIFMRDISPIGRLSWRLQSNGASIPPYNNIIALLGKEGEPERVWLDANYLNGGDVLSVLAINTDTMIDFECGVTVKGILL